MSDSQSNIEAVLPLSPMQQGMLFHCLAAPPDSGMYHQQLVCTLEGALDVDAFRAAWDRVLERHPALRAFFVWEGREHPLQVICRRAQPAWEIRDWEPGEDFGHWLAADRRRGFSAQRPPLVRFALLNLGQDRRRFVWSFHHLLLDGWCLPLVLDDLLASYRALRLKQPLDRPSPRPYRDYLAWLQARDPAPDRAYWRDYLRGFDSPTPLGLAGPEQPASAWGERDRVLTLAETEALVALARRRRLTLGVLVQTAWGILLGRYAGRRDVLFGSTVSGRPPELAGVESMVGVFINSLPVRLDLDPALPVAELAARLLADQARREAHAHAPLVEIQRAAPLSPGAALFQSLVVFENYPLGAARELPELGLKVAHIRGYERTNYPLTLLAMPGPPLTLRLAYDGARLDGPGAERLLEQLRGLLTALAADPDQPLGALPLLTATETRRLADWNATTAPFPAHRCLHELVEDQLRRNPEAVAVVAENRTLSQGQLLARAESLAAALQARGSGPEAVVGVCLERSPELVIALLAILKTGAAWLPLDPEHPRERLARVVEDAGAVLALTDPKLAHRLPPNLATLAPDAEGAGFTPPSVHPDNLAYVIFTSGSTGRPKGAMNSHRAIVNRLWWMQEEYRLETTDRVLQKTPMGFDVSVWEFFWPLLVGARLVLARPGGHRDPAYLRALIRREGITTLHFVPPMLEVFLQQSALETDCASLRQVICSGEALPQPLQQRFYGRLKAQLHNLYGPTEAAVDVTAWACPREGGPPTVPIGRPMANTRIAILDRDYRPAPVGVAGELYIGGVQLARGYRHRPGLTAERFVPDPTSGEPGARLYRSGDLARWRSDGTIDYLGRCDFQLKVRGLRVEPGDIESALGAHPGVREAVVVARGEGAARVLVGYWVAAGEAPPTAAELRRFLLERLPEPLTPGQLMRLPALPLTPNGKLDRRALPDPAAPATALDATPRSELEQAIAALWRESLKLERVGMDDNFFELGGNSLLLAPLHQKLTATLAPDLALTELFRYPTVRALAGRLAGTRAPERPPERTPERDAGRQTLAKRRQLRQEGRR